MGNSLAGVGGVARVPDHGGGLARAMARFGAGADWLDLSTGINPWPYPVPALAPGAWQRLPDEDALAGLKYAARGFYGAAPDAPIAAAPGSQALIQLLPQLIPPTEVAIVGPTYAEHARCWRLAGHSVIETSEPDGAMPVVVVVNPNNPNGRIWPAERLRALAAERAARGGLLVVDEAFAEVAAPTVQAAGMPGLVALRSFGKFFGLAGLRLGFALGPAALVERIEDALGPWAVSGPALAIGSAALADAGWAAATRCRLKAAAAALDAVLARAGFEPAGGTDLYRLAHRADAAAVFERLGKAHILVRNFAERPEWLRFGLPPDAAALARLERALG
jgi:cobalamin biosynthetic protein CobC